METAAIFWPHMRSMAAMKSISDLSETAAVKQHVIRANVSMTIFPVIIHMEETEAIATISTDIVSYVNNSMAEFITGQKKLDDISWEAYLKELDKLGLQELIKNSQAAYGRMK